MAMEVLVLAPFEERHMVEIRQAAGKDAVVKQIEYDRKKVFDVAVEEALATAEVVIGEPEPRLLKKAPNLKFIQMTWAGSDLYTNWIQFPEDVSVANVAGSAYGPIVSQYVVGQILAITQNLAFYSRQQMTHKWDDIGPVKTLEGAKVVIFGAGDIGSQVAKKLRAFDVGTIVGVCRDVAKKREHFDKLVTLSQAEGQIVDADIIVCCMPSTKNTARYFNKRRFERVKEGAVLVNVGRGDFIDIDALYMALSDGTLRGAALDVTNPEPLPLSHRLWNNPYCVITPHIAGKSFGHDAGTEDRICKVCCENLRRYIAGESLTHQVI
ncbi:MAG: D-2-hydroxyacid dehydrogenase [Eggerthellaceae bacterium]|nr:D-2-hydroxyacid dehydrogenase [Eggerthellaceae bacterium]